MLIVMITFVLPAAVAMGSDHRPAPTNTTRQPLYETGGRYLSDEVAAVDVPRCGGVDSGASVLM